MKEFEVNLKYTTIVQAQSEQQAIDLAREEISQTGGAGSNGSWSVGEPVEYDAVRSPHTEQIHEWYVRWANTLDSAGEDSTDARGRLKNYGVIKYMLDSMIPAIRAARHIDCLKKHVFYGRDVHDFKDYMPVQLTEAGIGDRLDDHNTVRLMHAIFGLFDEAGELMQALFEYIFFNQPIDRTNIKEEFGDSMWYLALGAKYLNEDQFGFIMASNYAKLATRYPEGAWAQDRALSRDLDAERRALDNGGNDQPDMDDSGRDGTTGN